jgi:hypothetical protein
MASAKSRGARREAGHAFPPGLAVWASKLSEGRFLGLGLKTKVRGLSEAKRPMDVPRHVPELVWVVWASKPPRRRVSQFGLQNWVGGLEGNRANRRANGRRAKVAWSGGKVCQALAAVG